MTDNERSREAESVVRAFFGAWGDTLDSLVAAMRRYVADDVLWEQTGLPTARSIDEAIGLLDGARRSGVAAMGVELRHVASAGAAVLTERIDRLLAADGSVIVQIPVMGVLELDAGGRIHRWREYFDISILAASRPS